MVILPLNPVAEAMGKLKVHEVRLFNPKPRPIQGLAFDGTSNRLAVVRCCVDEDGDRPAAYFLEIWNLSDSPCLEFKIMLSREWRESVEAVCWRSKTLLYVSGMHGHVLLINVETGVIVKTAAAVSGPVWCLGLSADKKRLAAGTEDGFVSVFNVEGEEMLEYIFTLEPKGSRVLSLSWHPTKPHLVSSGRGRIWLWDMKKQLLKLEMRPPLAGKQEVNIASVVLLKNNTIVSGDSGGSTIFWDTATGTPLTTFRSHRSGVLALAFKDSDEELRVFASGIDSLITEMRLVSSTNANGAASSTWVTSIPRYYHTHDVRALCYTGTHLISGGADAHLCIATDMANKFTKIPPNTDVSHVFVGDSYLSPGVPVLLCQHTNKLEIWQLSENILEHSGDSAFSPADHCQLLKFTLGKGSEIITASALSLNGEWFVASSARLTKAYRIVLKKDSKNRIDVSLVAAKSSNSAFTLPVERFAFCGDGNLIVADAAGIYACTMKFVCNHGHYSASIERNMEICSLRSDERIRLLAASKTTQHIAVVTSRNLVEIYDTLHRHDSHNHHSANDHMEVEDDDQQQSRTAWRILTPPQTSSLVTSISLSSHASPDLLIAYADGTVASFGLKDFQYTKIAGVWQVTQMQSAFTHSSVYENLAVFHNSKEGVVLGKDSRNGWTVKKFLAFDQHLINSILSPGGDLINVVQTPAMLQNQLPPALAKKIFGV